MKLSALIDRMTGMTHLECDDGTRVKVARSDIDYFGEPLLLELMGRRSAAGAEKPATPEGAAGLSVDDEI